MGIYDATFFNQYILPNLNLEYKKEKFWLISSLIEFLKNSSRSTIPDTGN